MAESSTARPRRIWTLVWATVALLALIAAAAVWFVLTRPTTDRYQPLLDDISANRVAADGAGRLVLSGPYAGLTPHDEMFLTRRPDGSFLALLPTFYPKGPAIVGLLYTSRPFGPHDTFSHGLGMDALHPFTSVGPWSHLRIDRRIDDHWYKVSQGVE